MADWIFAFFHLFLIIFIIGYAVYSLILGNVLRFFLIMGGLTLYYFIVLHKPVKKEIKRRRSK